MNRGPDVITFTEVFNLRLRTVGIGPEPISPEGCINLATGVGILFVIVYTVTNV